MKTLWLVLTISLLCTPALAWERRGPQQFTVTQPDGSRTIGEYTPDTGQVVLQSPNGFTVMQREPNNNWQTSIEPPDVYRASPPRVYDYSGDDD